MNIPQTTIVNESDRDVTFVRFYDAPRKTVFDAFSNADAVKQWWRIQDWKVIFCTLDFRPGGTWHYCLQGPEGQEHWAKAIYREIVEPERIVYMDGSSDADGNDVQGLPPSLTTVTFAEQSGVTKLTAHIQYASAADLEAVVARGMVQGFKQTLCLLETYLNNA